MKTRALLAVSLFVLTSAAFAQHCDELVWDDAYIFHSLDTLRTGAQALINEGADVKIVSVARLSSYGVTLKDVMLAMQNGCASWRSAGNRKANLIVFMVAPNDRKKNIFFGSAYAGPFPDEDTVNTLYSRAANPFFQSQQWDQGMATTMKDFAAKVVAYHDQKQHPAVTQVTNEATDLTGLWKVLMAFGIFGGLFFVGWLFWKIKTRMNEQDEELDEAQRNAINEFHMAAGAFVDLPETSARYSYIAERYQRLSNSVKMDPNEEMNVAEYRAVASTWRDFRQEITGTKVKPITDYSEPVPQQPAQEPGAQAAAQKAVVHEHHHHHTTVVNNNGSSSDGFVAGIVADELLRRPEPIPEPVHTPSTFAPDTFDGGSSVDSGSDSGWSSSFSDSGSGSSGSDSGFGGGGDSGGGGSDSSF